MSSKRFLAATLILFITLTAVMTYPQVLHMKDGVHDDGDPLMLTWVLAWVAHQLPRGLAGLALDMESAERVYGLWRQADVPHDGNFCFDEACD